MGRTRDAGGASLAIPLGDGAAPRVHHSGRDRAAERLRDGHPSRIRSGEMVAAPAAQSERPADQGRAALPTEHGGHERPVPPGALTLNVRSVRLQPDGKPVTPRPPEGGRYVHRSYAIPLGPSSALGP